MIKFFKNLGISLIAFLSFLLLALTIPVFYYLFSAYANPLQFNPYRIDNSDGSYTFIGGHTVDSYLHTGEFAVELIFVIVGAVFLLLFILDHQFRKKSSHIATTVLGCLCLFAFSLARAIFHFNNDELLNGLTDLASCGLVAAMAVFFVKKSLDGDCVLAYYVIAIVSVLCLYLTFVSSYSILDAFSYEGNIIFWCGYGVTRIYLLAYLLLIWTNLRSDFEPKEIEDITAE